MVRFRLSRPARADLARILATSAQRWGIEGRHRYAAILAAAMRKAAADPEGLVTRDRTSLLRIGSSSETLEMGNLSCRTKQSNRTIVGFL